MKKNAIAVIGLGRFGMPLANKLAEAGKEVIGVDMDEERVKEFREFSEYAFVAKKLSKEVLIDIGIQNCDLVAVCIGSKVETSILVTLNVLNLGVPVISKATSAEQGEVLRRWALPLFILKGTWRCASRSASCARISSDFLPIGKDIEIIEIEVSDRMVGKTIVDMDLRRRYSLNVIAIHHEEQIETDVRRTAACAMAIRSP
ncbi:MAG: TrkA family potassium uptake protein [Merdibacter sp.]